MKKILLTFVVSILLFSAFAQSSIDEFTNLKSEGEMPESVLRFLNQDLTSDEQNYFIKEMIKDGKILYGTKLNRYIEQIADHLLVSYPELRQQLHFLILKSPVVNASATEQGFVLVNLGLIAQVSNESELAFVLAHEISHFVEHHITELEKYREKISPQDYKDYFLRYHNRSRETEMAADKWAIERYYKDSPYSYEVLDGVFDVLQYSYLPFEEMPFPRSFVETDFYQFPENYFLNSVAPISNREDYVDTLSTHPNIQKRRANAQLLLPDNPQPERKVFVQSETLFNEIRALARFECINIFLTNHDYGDALYNTYVLQQLYPNNQFLQVAMSAALYGFSKHKNYGGIRSVLDNYKHIEGEKQQVHYFFSKVNRDEMLLLALRNAWITSRRYPNNDYLSLILRDLMRDLVMKNKMTYTDFSDYPQGMEVGEIPPETPAEITSDSTAVRNKYQQIKQTAKNRKVIPNKKFKTANFMLVDLRQDEDFMKLLETVTHECEDEKIHEIIADEKTFAVPEKIIVVNPYYYYSGKKKDVKTIKKNYEKSEKDSETLMTLAEKTTQKLDLNSEIYTIEKVRRMNTEQYNHYAKIRHWIADFIEADDVNMVYYQSIGIDSVIAELGTNSISLFLVHQKNSRFFNGRKVQPIIYTALMPFLLPVSALQVAFLNKSTTIESYLVNLETGKVIRSWRQTTESSIEQAYTHAFVYDVFYQIKKGK